MRLKGKVAVITGAGSGIGRECALHLASEGAHVVVSDLDPDTARRTADEVKVHGNGVISVKADVTSLEDIRSMYRLTEDTFASVEDGEALHQDKKKR